MNKMSQKKSKCEKRSKVWEIISDDRKFVTAKICKTTELQLLGYKVRDIINT